MKYPNNRCPRCGKDDWLEVDVVDVRLVLVNPVDEDDDGMTQEREESVRYECGYCGYEI